MAFSWVRAGASRPGTSHTKRGRGRDDAYFGFEARRDDVFVAVVCDGAGSVTRGARGATLTCRTLLKEVRAHFDETGLIGKGDIVGWIDDVREKIHKESADSGVDKREFATTVVMAIWTSEEFLTAHIGDGAIVVRDEDTGDWNVASWPETGEFASSTYFVTDDVPRIRIKRHFPSIDGIAVFSDGLERLVLDYTTREPSAQFFQAMLKPLEISEADGIDHELSDKLGGYLDSPKINERTDDDKTLLLAYRRR